MRKIFLFAPALVLAVLAGCGEDMPGIPEGDGSLGVVVVDTSGLIPGSSPGVPISLDSCDVRLMSRSHEYTATACTGPDGAARFNDLVSGKYEIFARREILIGNNKKLFTGGFACDLAGYQTIDSTVTVNLIATSTLTINEIFYTGSDASTFYFYDQFVELYNSSNDTLYLDGVILTRQAQTYYPDQDEVPYVRAIYAYQFPGTPVTGRQYPIAPKQFIVIAADAVNHQQWCAKSIDLSGADWECFNPLSADYDNPAVPNIVSIHPSNKVDYMINLVHNAVVIATGESYEYYEYEPGKIHILIPIETVIDGVEYATNTSATKELTLRVDAGFAGTGCTRYSGQSTERRELGLDTNDSSFDFMLNPKSTPGYSAAQ